MTQLILHHYGFSPYSEKVRLAFGHKNLDWQSVQTPVQAPKPDLTPLTGGYRRAPVLQIGADVYCDTLLILREIERRHPEPTLYPGNQRGLVYALSTWWDRATFFPAAKIATSIMGDQIPADFIEERKTVMRQDFSKPASLKDLPLNLQRMHAHMTWLADMLKDGRSYILGEQLSAADLTAYHMLWFIGKNGGPEAEAMLPLHPLRGWMDRVAALGYGRRQEMSAENALAAARDATPEMPRIRADTDPSGLKPGQSVVLRTDDYAREPVHGALVAANAEEVVIRHENERVGVVHIHFPRAGYDVLASEAAS
ncbi:MAG: glutathione S-transferase family protein [Acetobacteraceae bacterium]|nr:glutathione S-transferase family protein [Acetobacteraceae bacterium]